MTNLPQDPMERRRRLQHLDTARRELYASVRRRESAKEAVAHFSDGIDVLVREVFSSARDLTRTSVVVLALGGYGRRQLCPYSDVDLLVLFDGKIGLAEEEFLKAFLHPLWDLRLDLGHHVREVEDFEHLEKDNPKYLLALLDARIVCGDPSLHDRFYGWFHESDAQWYPQILDLLLQLVEQRHARFNHTFYQLEPDVKESPGALRDLVAARWINFLTDRNETRQLSRSGLRLEESEDFLLRVRALLHQESGRNHNVLNHALQEKAAETLGYPGSQTHHRVETFMSDYFRHARTIARFLHSTRGELRRRPEAVEPVPLGDNLERDDDEIRFVDARRAAAEPTCWLPLFRKAIDLNCRASDKALRLIQRHQDRFEAEDFFPSAQERDQLLDFLRPRAGLYDRLSEMHDCGLLGRMFPEFQAVFCRVIRDFYHKYTVDEHTLLTIRNLEQLSGASDAGREKFQTILRELRSPELLVMALLFHDVGKCKQENHAEESARMVQHVFRRLDLPPESAQIVEFLIVNHLQFSLVAFRRDTEDPEVVRKFAALVGTEENLKTLCLMTLVDIQAVSPETLTLWKEELLWQLYVDAYNHLTFGYSDDLIEKDQASLKELLASRPADVAEPELSFFLEGFPRRYLKLVDRNDVYKHVRLSRNIHPDEVHLSLEKQSDVWELSVVTLDKPYLFSNISGVLSYFGMDILRGQAMTNRHGLVLDIFQFTDLDKFFQMNPDAMPQFYRLLQDVVGGKIDLPTLLRGKERSVLYRRAKKRTPTLVHFDNHYSQRHTILEIVTQDALGLLYRISRVISRLGYNIDLVLISTEGNKAIDVFHINGKDGKLSEPEQRDLKSDLANMLEGIYETDQEHRPSEQGR